MTSVIMDSPSFQSSTHPARVRAHSTITAQSSVDNRGAVHKRASINNRNRSISISQADRLYRLAAEHSSHQAEAAQDSLQPSSIGVPWITPQHSPQLHGFATESSLESFPQWTVPTPPRSDSGIPTVSIDHNDEPVTTGISSGQDFAFEQPTGSAEMSSSLGFLLPSQYGQAPYDGEGNSYQMEQNFPPMRSQPTSTSGASAYAQTAPTSTPALYQTRMPESAPGRRQSEMPASSRNAQSYDENFRRTSNPYESSYSANAYSGAPNQTIPSISGLTQSPLPSPHMSSTSTPQVMPQQYNAGISRSPNMYESNPYGQAYTTAPAQSQMYSTSQQQNMSYPPPFVGSSVNEVLAKPLGADSSIRVLNQRPKPQCWEHGCNGRQFSTFSNLLRHQREKSGTAAKSYCPKCGAEFTRTTARNGHLAHDKCTKQRRQSDGK